MQTVNNLTAEFKVSVFRLTDLPEETFTEVAMVGRSNVGKSTLINAICQRKALAKVSSTPGKTQSINFYQLSQGGENQNSGYLVDLPGFGYAKVAKTTRSDWRKLIEPYLFSRGNLRQLLLLIDCRREIGEEEQWFLDHQSELPGLTVVLTKVDKLSTNQLKQKKAKMIQSQGIVPESFFLTGESAAGKLGIAGLRKRILDIFKVKSDSLIMAVN